MIDATENRVGLTDQVRSELVLATERRRERGREHTAETLNWWFTRNGFSHTQASATAEWTSGDSTALQTSQLSHLRNGRLATPQLKLFEGLASMNAAIASWLEKGSEWCIKQWGPVPKRLLGGATLSSACFLWHPSKTGKQPLVFHDFCDLFSGYLELPYVVESIWSPSQCREISDALGAELDTWLAQSGGMRAGMAKLKQLYPLNDAQLKKLQQVILGQSTYSPVELTEVQSQLVHLLNVTRINPTNTNLNAFIRNVGQPAGVESGATQRQD